jgi:hypothetical protein
MIDPAGTRAPAARAEWSQPPAIIEVAKSITTGPRAPPGMPRL